MQVRGERSILVILLDIDKAHECFDKGPPSVNNRGASSRPVLQMVENEIASRKQNRLPILVLYRSMTSRCAKP